MSNNPGGHGREDYREWAALRDYNGRLYDAVDRYLSYWGDPNGGELSGREKLDVARRIFDLARAGAVDLPLWNPKKNFPVPVAVEDLLWAIDEHVWCSINHREVYLTMKARGKTWPACVDPFLTEAFISDTPDNPLPFLREIIYRRWAKRVDDKHEQSEENRIAYWYLCRLKEKTAERVQERGAAHLEGINWLFEFHCGPRKKGPIADVVEKLSGRQATERELERLRAVREAAERYEAKRLP